MIDFVDAIKSLDSSYNVYIDGDINSQEDWDNKVKFITGKDADDNAIFADTKPITYAEVVEEQQSLQADYDAKQYQRDRASKYPAIGDQLDKLWHSINADDTLKTQFADFYNTIKAVKDKYPKE
jgi:hypothetical protein